jgi:hypothetical protein
MTFCVFFSRQRFYKQGNANAESIYRPAQAIAHRGVTCLSKQNLSIKKLRGSFTQCLSAYLFQWRNAYRLHCSPKLLRRITKISPNINQPLSDRIKVKVSLQLESKLSFLRKHLNFFIDYYYRRIAVSCKVEFRLYCYSIFCGEVVSRRFQRKYVGSALRRHDWLVFKVDCYSYEL